MKLVVRPALTAFAAAAAMIVSAQALAAGQALTTEKQKTSYMVGMSMAGNMPDFVREELDPKVVARAVETVLSGEEPALSGEEAANLSKSFQEKMRAKAAARIKADAAKNKSEGEAFLAANKGKSGVKVTESGLQYKVERQGNGPKPKATDTVKVNYEGSLLDGTVFDSSYKRGEPTTFPLNGVVPGWSEAVQLMPVGSKYTIWIPSDLAYGDKPAGPIGPNSTLKFTVELLEIMPKEAKTGSDK